MVRWQLEADQGCGIDVMGRLMVHRNGPPCQKNCGTELEPEPAQSMVLAGWSRVICVVRELPGDQGEEGLESGSVGVGGIELDSGGKQS
ncbi:MAG: hypothetical protein RLZZ117_1209 [Cyanobacteriota bacterium]